MRRGDTRTIWVFGILAVFILVLSLSGLWKQIDSFVFVAKLLGFDTGTPPEGSSILGVNLDNGDLRYFTGEKWRVIKLEDETFVLGKYEIIPQQVFDRFKKFYEGERRPSTFKISVNTWRYWSVFPRGVNPGDYLSDWGAVPIQSRVKLGFVGFDDGTLNELGYLNPITNIFTFPSGSVPYILTLESTKYADAITKVIMWRDQILEGKACEKFLTLDISRKLSEVSASLPSGVTQPPSYTVRKLDNYIFVDLDNPAAGGAVDVYTSNPDCFKDKIEVYDDKVDRSGWNNVAKVAIEFRDGDLLRKYWWNFGGELKWSMQGDGLSYSKDYDIILDYKFVDVNAVKDFYAGLMEIPKVLKDVSAKDIKSSIYPPSGGEPKVITGSLQNLPQFNYQILDAYNEYFLPASYNLVTETINVGDVNYIYVNGRKIDAYFFSGGLYISFVSGGERFKTYVGSVIDDIVTLSATGKGEIDSLRAKRELSEFTYAVLKDLDGKKYSELLTGKILVPSEILKLGASS